MSLQTAPRLPDWQQRLNATLGEWLQKPYDAVGCHCIHLVGDGIAALTGLDLYAEAGLPAERTLSALKALRREYGTAAAGLTRHLGEPQGVLTLRIGDFVLMPGSVEDSIGIVVGSDAVGCGDQGLQRVSLGECLHGWRMGTWPKQ